MHEIREKRKEMGVSQAGLASAAGMDPAMLNRIEQGKANPNLKTIERLARALGVEVGDFFPKAQAPLPFEVDPAARGEKGDVSLGVPVEEVIRARDMLQGLRDLSRKQMARWRKILDEAVKQGQPLDREQPEEWISYQTSRARVFIECFEVFDRLAQFDGLSSVSEWPSDYKTLVYEAAVSLQALYETASRAAKENDRLWSEVRDSVLEEEFSTEEFSMGEMPAQLPAQLTSDPEWDAMWQKELATW